MRVVLYDVDFKGDSPSRVYGYLHCPEGRVAFRLTGKDGKQLLDLDEVAQSFRLGGTVAVDLLGGDIDMGRTLTLKGLDDEFSLYWNGLQLLLSGGVIVPAKERLNLGQTSLEETETGRMLLMADELRVAADAVFGSATFGDGGQEDYSTFDDLGALTFHGAARPRRVLHFGASQIAATVAEGATKIDHGIGIAWAFADAVRGNVVILAGIPAGMDRTEAPRLVLQWSSPLTAGAAVWQAEYLYRAPGEPTSAAAQGTVRRVVAPSATADGLVETDCGFLDLPAEGQNILIMRIARLGVDPEDTLAGVANLLGIRMEYTAGKI